DPSVFWFYTLLARSGGLLSFYPIEELGDGIIVRRKYKAAGDENKAMQLFAKFNNSEHLYNYILGHSEEQRDFYEFVFDTQWQKPRFDIDIDDTMVPISALDSIFTEVLKSLLAAIL